MQYNNQFANEDEDQVEQLVERAIQHLSCLLEPRLSAYEQTQYRKGMQTLGACLEQIKADREAKRFTGRRLNKAS